MPLSGKEEEKEWSSGYSDSMQAALYYWLIVIRTFLMPFQDYLFPKLYKASLTLDYLSICTTATIQGTTTTTTT